MEDASDDAAASSDDAQRADGQPATVELEDAAISLPDATGPDGCTPNACGGCSALSAAPAAHCGMCGVGRYACAGADALTCNGGDATPSATSGTMIDDWEDGDSLTLSGDGYTYAFGDGSAGTLDPVSGAGVTPAFEGAAGTKRSAHVSGSGFTNFGAGLITRPNTDDCAFDAATTRGIGFWIKATKGADLYVSVATTQTTDASYCGNSCNDHYTKTLSQNGDWSHYTLQWTNFSQEGWGTQVPFDASQLQYLQFWFGTNVAFDLYLDELSFF